jgi:chaperone modulatory protein CbpM
MSDNRALGLAAELVDETALCTVEELSVACSVDPKWIAELAEHGVIEPIGQDRSDWKFTNLSIVRVAKARRLERDLSLNPASLAIVLDLLDEIDDLRVQLARRTAK